MAIADADHGTDVLHRTITLAWRLDKEVEVVAPFRMCQEGNVAPVEGHRPALAFPCELEGAIVAQALPQSLSYPNRAPDGPLNAKTAGIPTGVLMPPCV